MPTNVGSVRIDLGTLDLIEKNSKEAQKRLNMQVVADMEPLVPFRQGALRGSVRYPDGIYGTYIEYATPYARYMYFGKVMKPNIPIKDLEGNVVGWWSPPNKYLSNQDIVYHTPGTQALWFEEAKAQHLSEWEELVKKTLMGGG